MTPVLTAEDYAAYLRTTDALHISHAGLHIRYLMNTPYSSYLAHLHFPDTPEGEITCHFWHATEYTDTSMLLLQLTIAEIETPPTATISINMNNLAAHHDDEANLNEILEIALEVFTDQTQTQLSLPYTLTQHPQLICRTIKRTNALLVVTAELNNHLFRFRCHAEGTVDLRTMPPEENPEPYWDVSINYAHLPKGWETNMTLVTLLPELAKTSKTPSLTEADLLLSQILTDIVDGKKEDVHSTAVSSPQSLAHSSP